MVAAIGLTDLRIAFSGGSLNAVTSMIAASDALTVLPYSVVFSLRRAFGIEALNIRIEHPERDLCMVLRDDPAAQILRRFERFTKATIAALEATILHAERKAGTGPSSPHLSGLIHFWYPTHRCAAGRWRDPLTDLQTGAGEGIRTLDPNLGKVMLYP